MFSQYFEQIDHCETDVKNSVTEQYIFYLFINVLDKNIT